MLYPLPAVMVSCAGKDYSFDRAVKRNIAGEYNSFDASAERNSFDEADERSARPNIITVAWAGTVCTNPAMVSISVRPERYSYGLIRESGEFVINLTTETLVRAMDFCGVRSGRDVDKFEQLHLTQERASAVNVPLVAESPVNIECRVRQVLELGSHHMFLADVLAVDVDEQYLDTNGRFDLNRAGLAAYSHGTYFALGRELGTFGYSVRRKTGKPVETGKSAKTAKPAKTVKSAKTAKPAKTVKSAKTAKAPKKK